MEEKKPWYDRSNEKEPGNPLSRHPQWDLEYQPLWTIVYPYEFEKQIAELLAVIDQMQEDRALEDERHIHELEKRDQEVLEAEERERQAFKAARLGEWNLLGGLDHWDFEDFDAWKASQREKEEDEE